MTAMVDALPVPAMLDGLPAGEDWRENFAWPAPFAAIVGPLHEIPARYLRAVAEVDDADLRAVLLMGRPMMPLLALAQYAIWSEAAARSRMRLSGDEVLDYLRGDIADGALPFAQKALNQARPRVGLWWLRRLVRTATWTPLHCLPKTMLCPDWLALNHNPLLRSYLRAGRHAVRYAYETDFDLAGTPVDATVARKIDVAALTDHMLPAVTGHLDIGDEIRRRMDALLLPVLAETLADAADAVGRVRSLPNLPSRLYSGTGSKRLSRLLGLELMRRGGEAIRCDHGGSFVLLPSPATAGLTELSVSSRFVTFTPAAAAASGLVEGQRLVSRLTDCALEGHTGDPSLDVGTIAFERTAAASPRRRVMYVSTLYYSFHQVTPPVMPAPLYLDWQLRLIDMLAKMPVRLLCKPHPGGVMPPSGLALSRFATVLRDRFESVVAEADVLLYDFPATTTLALGLCTDRPIVLIDHGTMHFSDTVRAAVHARCNIIPAHYDDRNRPVVDAAAIETAICDGADTADPSFFRKLFLGRV